MTVSGKPSVDFDAIGLGGPVGSLQNLVQNSESLIADIYGATDLPRVTRSVNQMMADSEQLLSRSTEGHPGREQADMQAAILLGSRGFDLPKLSHQVDRLLAPPTFGSFETIAPTDIDGFLKFERQNALLGQITSTNKNTQEELDAFAIRAQKNRWEEEKAKVLSSIELIAGASSEQRLQSLNDSLALSLCSSSFLQGRVGEPLLLPSASGVPSRSQLSAEELKYARALSEHNAALVAGGVNFALMADQPHHTLIDRMAAVAEQMDLRDVALLWQLLQTMQTARLTTTDIGMAPTSADARSVSRPDVDKLALAQSARKFLESKHLKDMRLTVFGNLNKASLGGVPGNLHLIRAYLNVKPVSPAFPDEPLVEGHPVWAVLYHAIRCGDMSVAREVALKAGFADLAGKFQECQRNPGGRLGDASAHDLRLKYLRDFGGCPPGYAPGVAASVEGGSSASIGASAVIAGGSNPYQRVVLAVLAGCGLANEHLMLGPGAAGYTSALAGSDLVTEDYLWIKLCNVLSTAAYDGVSDGLIASVVQPTVSGAGAVTLLASSDKLTLGALQRLIADDLGENHFDAYQRPLQYAYVLLLSVQFELAVEFLHRLDGPHRCHAVHMAIALQQLGVLAVSSNLHDPLLVRSSGLTASVVTGADRSATISDSKINLARLVTTYTRRFEALEPELALEYYFAIKLTGDGDRPSGVAVLKEAPKTAESLWSRCVCELALSTCQFERLLGRRNTDGSVTRGAIDKFIGGGERVSLIAAVAEAAEARGQSEDAIGLYDLAGERENCVQLLTKLVSLLVTQAGPDGSKRAELQKLAHQVSVRYPSPSLSVLMDLMDFFDLYHASKNEEAVDLVRRLQLVPLEMSDVDGMVSTFCSLTEQVRRVIPDVLLSLMTIFVEQYKTIKRPTRTSFIPFLGGGSEGKIEVIKKQASAIVKYAGMVPYRLPGNINARLVQMQANIT